MEITEVRVFLKDEERLRAYVTITFDNAFIIRNIKIVKINDKLIVSMPSRKTKEGVYKDIAHPINVEMRQKLEKAVLDAYEKELKNPHVRQSDRRENFSSSDAGI
ncbi:MAG: putative septation protein SpoVG [Elusimicrobia bacterium ADurb.Bin231]|nr:MAG: putative septation protein SpoVG [Elusimicrobia bacterium ADurb.Bin231]